MNKGVRQLTVWDRKFARVFSSWILQQKTGHTRKSMAIGHSNEPVMLAQLSHFLGEEAGDDNSLVSLPEFGVIVQRERNWLGTSPDALAIIVHNNDSLFSLASDTDNIFSTLVDSLSNNRAGILECAHKYYNLKNSSDISTLPKVGRSSAEDVLKYFQNLCQVELKTKTSSSTASQLCQKWIQHGNSKRYFRMIPSEDMAKKLPIPQTNIDQCMHHETVLSSPHCLYFVGTVRSIVYVVLFEFLQSDKDSYVSTLEKNGDVLWENDKRFQFGL